MIVEIEHIIKIVLAFVLSAVVGFEREVSLKPAGLRTHILVGLASSLLTILSIEAFPGADTSRIAAAIIIGIGFLGAGTIIKTKEKILGLTTAATVWTVAAIGVAVGAEFYVLAIVATVLAYLALKLAIFEEEITESKDQ
jgi:putative Mg2+ transporter-C (MgtC) family protein